MPFNSFLFHALMIFFIAKCEIKVKYVLNLVKSNLIVFVLKLNFHICEINILDMRFFSNKSISSIIILFLIQKEAREW